MKEWLGQSFDLSVESSSVAAAATAAAALGGGGRRRRPKGGGTNNNNNTKLDWSLDPHHADWTIEIICKEENTSTLYNVHKIILAAGPWKCNYFEKLLEKYEREMSSAVGGDIADDCTVNTGNQTNTTTTTTTTTKENKRIRVKLNKLAADVFPLLLDYCYGAPTAKLKVDTHTATGLSFLGKCFENKWLTWESKQFIDHDLSLENCHIYYLHARILSDDYVLRQITELLVVNIKALVENTNNEQVVNKIINEYNQYHPMVKVADPEFWLPIFAKRQNSEQYADKIPPCLIADICEWNASCSDGGISEDVFNELTSETYMPYVDPDIGKRMLMICPIVDKLTSLHVRILTRAPPNFVLDVCEHMCLEMTPGVFETITSEEFLPDISGDDNDIIDKSSSSNNNNNNTKCDLACRLLRIEPKFRVIPDSNNNNGNDNEGSLTPLQQRCLQTFIDNWSTLSEHEQIVDFLQTQNPLFIKRICLGTATQLSDLQTKFKSMQSVLNKTLIREREMTQDYEKEIERLNDLLCNSMIALK